MAGGSLKIKVGKTQNKTPKYHQIVCRGVKEQQYNENIHCPWKTKTRTIKLQLCQPHVMCNRKTVTQIKVWSIRNIKYNNSKQDIPQGTIKEGVNASAAVQ